MKKKLQSFQLIIVMLCCVASMQSNAQLVYTETFTSTQGNATAAQLTAWNNYRATLVPLPYSKMKITGVTTTGSGTVTLADSCLDPIMVQDIAMRLRTFTSASPIYTWVDGSRTWRVGNCGATATTGPEISMNQNICACTNPGRSVRAGCATCFNNNGAWGFADCGNPTVTFTIEFFYGYPCTSTPTANITGPYQVCANKPFKLQPDKYYADATYTWQYSDNAGASWQNWTGPVDPYSGAIVDAIVAPRSYKLTITCNANPTLTYTTSVWDVTLAQFMYCYCDNTITNSAGLDIGNVTILNTGTSIVALNNGTSTPYLSNVNAKNTYSNFQYTAPQIPMYKNGNYKITVSEISSNATFKQGNVVAYIDYNRNGIFDGNEKVMTKSITSASAVPYTESDYFTVPATASYGLTGMRVILSSATTDSCGVIPGASTEGEIEDYIIDIRYDPCKGKANAGTVMSTAPSLCKGYDYVISDTTYEKKQSELERFWQVSADNIVWNSIAGSTNKDTLMRVFNGQPLFYRMRMVCVPTADTTFTPIFSITPKDGYKCYCYSQAEGGRFYDTSDIGGASIATFVKNTPGAHLSNPNAVNKREDFTDDAPTILFADSTYQMMVYHTMKSAQHGDAKITVFMDFNNNKEYDIPYERVYTGYTSIGNFTLVDNIVIPHVLITGVPTGMRVILNNDIAPNTPSDMACGGYKSGETMDWIVQFQRNFPAGIDKLNGITDFDMFPNPNNGKFRLQFTSSNKPQDVIVTVTNVTGQQIEQFAFKHNGGLFTKEMDMSNHTAGVYFVEIKAGDEMSKKKLIIK